MGCAKCGFKNDLLAFISLNHRKFVEFSLSAPLALATFDVTYLIRPFPLFPLQVRSRTSAPGRAASGDSRGATS